VGGVGGFAAAFSGAEGGEAATGGAEITGCGEGERDFDVGLAFLSDFDDDAFLSDLLFDDELFLSPRPLEQANERITRQNQRLKSTFRHGMTK
jgi:hypothetical protein